MISPNIIRWPLLNCLVYIYSTISYLTEWLTFAKKYFNMSKNIVNRLPSMVLNILSLKDWQYLKGINIYIKSTKPWRLIETTFPTSLSF